jgi:hypothetical protein
MAVDACINVDTCLVNKRLLWGTLIETLREGRALKSLPLDMALS